MSARASLPSELYVVGVGEPLAGDDAVGIAVLERLRATLTTSGIKLRALRDPSELATLLAGAEHALVIDAVLDPDHAGRVALHRLQDLDSSAKRAVSSHGIDTVLALELGQTLASPGEFPEVSLLAISIAPPARFSSELSRSAQGAVELATQRALDWVREASHA